MKKIVNILLSATALLAILPLALADGEGQTQVKPDYLQDGAIGYNKTISVPDEDGIYTITLESFATGTSQKIQKSVRSDIVLVLDISTSMREALGDGSQSYRARAEQDYTYNSYGNNTYYYLYTDGNYYPVSRDGRRLRFNTGTNSNPNYHYLYGTSVQDNRPSQVSYNWSTIWRGVLYEYGETRRIDALKVAVKDFIDLIDQNDTENAPANQQRLGNRIAIVTYGQTANTLRNFTGLDNASQLKDAVDNISIPDNNGTNTHLGMQRASELLSGNTSTAQIKTAVLFTDGNPGQNGAWDGANGYANAAANYREYEGQLIYQYTWYCANQTINYAKVIKDLNRESSDPAQQIIANVFTVSIIPEDLTSDYTKVYLGKASSDWLGSDNMGSITVTRTGGGYGGYTYTTTGWKSPIWDNGNGTRNPKSKDYSSSDDDRDKIDFSLTANSADELRAAFATIADVSGGSPLPMSEESIAEVDVVSASFVIPSDIDPEDIVIKVAKCTSRVEKTYYDEDAKQNKTKKFLQFDTPKTINIFSNPKVLSGYTYTKVTKDDQGQETSHPNTPIDESLRLTFDKSNSNLEKEDMVKLTGFDYGGNFCGPIYDVGWTEQMEGSDDHIIGYQGYKIILEIPIKMNPKAVGGPDMDTNGPGSGITVNGTQAVTFKSPHVSLPVNIWVRKEGLEVGESARFMIQRALIPDEWKDDDWEKPEDSTDDVYKNLPWADVSSIFVTRHAGQAKEGENAPVTKAIGLPSVDNNDNEFIYRIIEKTDWSWSYTPGTVRVFTTDQLETNPFVFSNTLKTDIDVMVRHAESKATNTFKDGNFVVDGQVVKVVTSTHVSYDDSKPNTRGSSSSSSNSGSTETP